MRRTARELHGRILERIVNWTGLALIICHYREYQIIRQYWEQAVIATPDFR